MAALKSSGPMIGCSEQASTRKSGEFRGGFAGENSPTQSAGGYFLQCCHFYFVVGQIPKFRDMRDEILALVSPSLNNGTLHIHERPL